MGFISLFTISLHLLASTLILPETYFSIEHGREKLELEKLLISYGCYDFQGQDTAKDCVKLEGVTTGPRIEFKSDFSDPKGLATSRLKFELTREDRIFCVGMKVIFSKYPNQIDDVLYEDRSDRYSILSYCNSKDLPPNSAINRIYSNSRAQSWSDFRRRFKAGIALNLRENRHFSGPKNVSFAGSVAEELSEASKDDNFSHFFCRLRHDGGNVSNFCSMRVESLEVTELSENLDFLTFVGSVANEMMVIYQTARTSGQFTNLFCDQSDAQVYCSLTVNNLVISSVE